MSIFLEKMMNHCRVKVGTSYMGFKKNPAGVGKGIGSMSVSLSSLQLVYLVPPEHLLNNGSLNTTDTWFFEYTNLPPMPKGSRLNLETSFDFQSGGTGLDNVQMTTQQRWFN